MSFNLRGVTIEDVQEHYVSDVNKKTGLDQPPFVDVLTRVTLRMTLADKDVVRGVDQIGANGTPRHIHQQERLANALKDKFGPGVLTVDRGTDPRVIFGIWTLTTPAAKS
jgi:hypothetical protein